MKYCGCKSIVTAEKRKNNVEISVAFLLIMDKKLYIVLFETFYVHSRVKKEIS